MCIRGPGEGGAHKAILCERLIRRAQAVNVPAPMVCSQLPAGLCSTSALPYSASGAWLEDLCPQVAHLGKFGGVEGSSVEGLSQSASSHPARVEDWGLARGTPWVELEDIVRSTFFPCLVACPVVFDEVVLGCEVLILSGAVIEIWIAVAVSVAGLAARGAPVREPETALAIVANVGAVGAPAVIGLDRSRFRVLAAAPRRKFGIDGVPCEWHDHGPVRINPNQAKQ